MLELLDRMSWFTQWPLGRYSQQTRPSK